MDTLTLKQLTNLLQRRDLSNIPSYSVGLRKLRASILFAFGDMLAILFSLFFSLILRDLLFPGKPEYLSFFTYLPAFMVVHYITFYLRGLYPAFGIDIISEIKNITYSTVAIYIGFIGLTFFVKGDWDYSRFAIILSIIFSLITIPLFRSSVRKIFGKKNWWGIPVIVVGAGNAGEKVIRSLHRYSQIGLEPIVAIDDNIDRWGYIDKVPVIGGLDVIPDLSKKLKVQDAIFAMPRVDVKRQQEIMEKYSSYFENVTIIPDLYGINSIWVSSQDIGGIFGLEVQKKLLKGTSLLTKRVFDILAGSILLILSLPFIAIIAAAIKLDSKGSIFFRQERMGKSDTRFRMLKFRTMHIDAENRLQHLLESNEELRKEYEVYHKLKNDPRMTRIGKFLRKYSLDELPQFYHVIVGEMSLIGPRTYMPWEKSKMNGMDKLILKVKPGISGLWQVTGRSYDSSFEERNITDVYYIRNWSIFLDLYIFFRTIAVILMGYGG